MSPASFPRGHRTRYLPAMTRRQLDALPARASAIVIVPTGSIEQHGPHLPLGVDAILGQLWLDAALAHVPAGAPVYVGPSMTFGKSIEHSGFAGTLSISTRTLHRLLKSIARQVHALGFRTLAVLNTHGGNSTVLSATLREIQTELGMNAGMLSFGWKPSLPEQEAAFGFHAGRFETALMLAGAPHLVRMAEAVSEYPARLDDPGELRPEGAPATAAWITADLSKSGVMGDARAATKADGEAWLEAGGRVLAAQILRLCGQIRAGVG